MPKFCSQNSTSAFSWFLVLCVENSRRLRYPYNFGDPSETVHFFRRRYDCDSGYSEKQFGCNGLNLSRAWPGHDSVSKGSGRFRGCLGRMEVGTRFVDRFHCSHTQPPSKILINGFQRNVSTELFCRNQFTLVNGVLFFNSHIMFQYLRTAIELTRMFT